MQLKEILGFNVLNEDFNSLLIDMESLEKIIVNTISPNSYGISTYDESFKEALDNSVLVLDGVYFALASILKGQGGVKENQGPHITKKILERANQKSLKVFFLGSTDETLKKIKNRIAIDYPNIVSQYYSPPFREVFSLEENASIFNAINSFNPNILLLGMTCPKQEKWIVENSDRISFNIGVSVGGVFDWYAGNRKEIPQIWWDLKLGWLYRIVQRPEIIKRNFKNTVIFLKDLVKEVVVFWSQKIKK